MLYRAVAIAALPCAFAQHFGHQTTEYHLPMPVKLCEKSAGCAEQETTVVLDSNWRWTHATDTVNNCFTGNAWNASYCPDWETCTADCAIDGVDLKTWNATYGIHSSGGALNLTFVTNGSYAKNVGSRTYLMDTPDTYKIFKLKNKEFTFDVDVSKIGCGINGALYFVEMDADGGKSRYPTNLAGANLGTGYCDAQCPHDLKWINGEANMIGWNSSSKTPTKGQGHYGTCCAELDIWEANAYSTQMTVHGCSTKGQTRCEGIECGDNSAGQRFNGTCDKDGCDFNPFRVGSHNFFGPGDNFSVNSLKPVTVVTQFITADGTDDGDLVEMRRFYMQDGKRIANPKADYGEFSQITDEMCVTQKSTFGDYDDFTPKGGVRGMGEAMGRGMVLVLSLWDDDDVHMLWLDSTYPIPEAGQPPKRGAPRGTCATDSGDPSKIEADYPHSSVVFSNIKYGEINSTFGPSPPPSPPSGCPGGSLSACIGLCPANPPAVYRACVQNCAAKCTGGLAAAAPTASAEDAKMEAQIARAPLKARLAVAQAKEAAAKALEDEIEAEIAALSEVDAK